MIAFNGDKLLKAGRIKLVKDKITSGQLVHGTYGEMQHGVMRGCAVFVTTCQSDNPHSYYESELGIPKVLARFEDVIFEGLKPPYDKQWPVKFLEAIEPGADLSLVSPKFLYWLMLKNLKYEKLWREQDKKNEYADKVVAAIKQVAKLLKSWAATGLIDDSARSAARSAEAAAWSAETDFYIKCSEKLLELLREAPLCR